MKNNPPPPSIRKLMPEGFLGTLADRTGCTSVPDLSQIVRLERSRSKYWPAVLKLAKETNPQGFASWAAANPDKLPAVAQAA
jgi:hypothetical protein